MTVLLSVLFIHQIKESLFHAAFKRLFYSCRAFKAVSVHQLPAFFVCPLSMTL